MVIIKEAGGYETSQFDYGPCDLSFDRENNLYILDYNNQCVKKISN